MKLDERVFEGCDPDSSLYAWNNVYRKIYTEDNWCFGGVFDFNQLKVTGKCSEYRYLAINRKESLEFPQFNEWLNQIQLGGDTDFNFKSGCKRNKKYEYYRKLIENEDCFSNEEKDKYIIRLDRCKDRHHSLENFSLMLVTGGLNNFKGSLSQDRVDKFIFLLNEYFVSRETVGYDHVVFSKAKARNKEIRLKEENTIKLKKILFEYLKLFSDINDYCSKIYKITDEKLVSKLINSGSKSIESGQDVVAYMELAGSYWDNKMKILNKENNFRREF